jgi:twitching motility protein PilT
LKKLDNLSDSNNSFLDEIFDAFSKSGAEALVGMNKSIDSQILTEVVDRNIRLEADAVRMLPSGIDGKVALCFTEDKKLKVLWEREPSPADISAVSAMTGLPISPCVARNSDDYQFIYEKAQDNYDQKSVLVAEIMDYALEVGTSDIHISIGSPPMIRVGTELVPIPKYRTLSAHDLKEIADYLTGPLPEGYEGDHDCAATYKGRRLRISLYRQRGQFALAMRVIPERIPSPEELLLPRVVERLSEEKMGLVLVCGVTGSGKSTTLASVLNIVNNTRKLKIITIEDPVEYIHTSKMSLVHQREVGDDTASFHTALRAAMRQDPDVILIGEMRDKETMSAAISAAETGHLVLATVHALDAVSTINRIVDIFPPDQQPQIRLQLSNTLKAIIVQRLLPMKNDPTSRRLIAEILVVNHAASAAIRENSLQQIATILQTTRNESGSMPFAYSLAEAVASGDIDILEAQKQLNKEQQSTFTTFLDSFPPV